MLSKTSVFARNTAGTAAVEFAILGSTFFMLLLGHFEVGYLLFLQHRLDDATVAASRTIQLGISQRAQDDTVQKFRNNRLCPAMGSSLDCSRVIVDTGILSASNANFDSETWAKTPIGSSSGTTFCIGAAGEYMFLRVSYPQAPVLGAFLPAGMFTLYGGQRVTMLQSFATWRIEPVEARRTGPCE
ncbi:TadE/TadG family type IV pilus assembly protein [Aureimonas pseudogalii]|uniref:Flp pilus assembly protein TadG n=1 Tax=Aureimonas pseudogalii TaxID=1744844 RepID=A0A7W6H664_9HYPH|nr:TadE/TadG family type IV pilus assembly protein [Aureimonas pseudogalii]MBB3999305.1 Flp pilus assembly protein TadG [Aureimonas pseudogalii]